MSPQARSPRPLSTFGKDKEIVYNNGQIIAMIHKTDNLVVLQQLGVANSQQQPATL
jgi:hypothetical protein